MVYREPADALFRRQQAATGPLARVDVSGRDGRGGAHGAPGRDGSSAGEDGGAGGDAGPAEPGQPGGGIHVRLVADPGRDAVAYVTGHAADAEASRPVDTEIAFARAGEVELVARGGGGGNGGHGGRGGDGARGRKGSDATRYSSGGNGGPGGDGGPGGNGSSGAPGGRGGGVVVRVSDHDTHLLMLVAHDVAGGRGGARGANGPGGDGGPGGRGGSSYSWTESESYTDANGQRQTRSVSRSNPGGSSGPPGSPGRSGTAHLVDGVPGAPGSFAIEVERPDGVARYPSRYDVRLVSFRHRNANDDGIYEPEEQVFVSHVEVENVGGMPTPAHHDVRVRVLDDGWIAPHPEQSLVLPRSLAPGARYVFTREELALTLRVFRPQEPGPPLAAPETIHLLAEVPSARRRFGPFESTADPALGQIVVRFPLEVSPLTGLWSLAPGQAARLRWTIRNVSSRAFGLESLEGRAVSVRLVRDGGDLAEEDILFFDETGARVPLTEGFARAVAGIGPNQTVAFEGTIAVRRAAAPYASARFVVAAELGHIAAPARARPIQLQELTVRVGRPFDACGADVLFVVGNRTTAEELAAWEDQARALGLTSSTWDAALEGGVSVLRDAAEGAPRFGLVVILDDVLDTPAGERRPSVLVDKDTSLRLARAGTHVLYVGPLPELDALLVPTPEAEPIPIKSTTTRRDVLAALDAEPIGGAGAAIETATWYLWPWSVPTPEALTARAEGLARALARRAPDRRHVVVHRFEPELEKKVLWARRVRLGTLEARRTFDAARGALSGLPAEAAAMHAAPFVRDPRTLAALANALPFDRKLRLLLECPLPFGAARPAAEDGCADALVAAVLADLLREQETLAHERWRAGASKEALRRALPMLAELARGPFSDVTLESVAGQRLVELAAWLDLVARDHARLWEWAPPLLWSRRGPALRSVVRALVKELLEAAFGRDEAAREAVTRRLDQLRAGWRARRKALEAPARAHAYARAVLAAAVRGQESTTCAGAFPRGAVLDGAAYEARRAKDRDREARARDVVAGAASARAALLRPETCEALVARAEGAVRVAAVDDSVETAAVQEAAVAWAELAATRDPAAR